MMDFDQLRYRAGKFDVYENEAYGTVTDWPFYMNQSNGTEIKLICAVLT